MSTTRTIILALGTNVGNDRMGRAHVLLSRTFRRISFSRTLLTEPIGIESAPFLNGLAIAATRLTKRQVRKKLKRAERQCGNTRALRRRNVVAMDIDLLAYGQERLKADDWNRHYIKQLMKEMNIPTTP
jgi:2-amino-4-hydroxy-6-hydroxymethyldihydropteridine diphosphokinase